MNYMQAFRDTSTCNLSDACDTLGIVPATSGQVKGVYAGCPPICGPIITCKMSPTGKKEIVDGCVRDVQATAALNFPTYSRGTVVQSVRTRVGIESLNEPVMFAGTEVAPGSIAAADANGVIVFPADRAVEIFRAAYRAAAVERKIVQAMMNGADYIAIHKALKFDASMKDQYTDDKIVG